MHATRIHPGPNATPISLTPDQRCEMEPLARSMTAPYRDVVRAKIVLLAAEGATNAEVSRRVGESENTVRLWRDRFAAGGTKKSLQDQPRSGRPAMVSTATRCELIKLACSRPDDKRAPFRDIWTQATLAEALHAETRVRLSRSEIGRILRAEEIRPHRVRMWLHSPDPDFTPKVEAICKLYLDPPKDGVVVCVDEKTGIQALGRKHPGRPAVPGRDGRREFEYLRRGTRCLLAGFSPHTGQVYGDVRATRTAEDTLEFMNGLAARYPDRRVHVIWDNLNTHHGDRWIEFNKAHGGRFTFTYTPIHASWVNQVEIWFGILHRRVLKYGEFDSVEHLAERLLGFIDHWNHFEAHPFRWKFRGKGTGTKTPDGTRAPRRRPVPSVERSCPSSPRTSQTPTTSRASWPATPASNTCVSAAAATG